MQKKSIVLITETTIATNYSRYRTVLWDFNWHDTGTHYANMNYNILSPRGRPVKQLPVAWGEWASVKRTLWLVVGWNYRHSKSNGIVSHWRSFKFTVFFRSKQNWNGKYNFVLHVVLWAHHWYVGDMYKHKYTSKNNNDNYIILRITWSM